MTSIVDTSVKHAYSSMTGAPVISSTQGSLIAGLKAFLVTGWGTKAVDSAAVSNGMCRLTFASGKSAAEVHAVITVAGASPSALNGEQRVTAVANGWVEFKTDLPDGPVTGSISFKMSGLGWEEVFSKTNVSVFRATDPRGTRAYLRVDDSNASFARVQMFESMNDVDTGVGVAPSAAGGFYWHKRQAANATGTYWVLIGDSQGFYITAAPSNGSTPTSMSIGATTRYFGDIRSYRSGDAWCAYLSGALSSSVVIGEGCAFQDVTQGSRVIARAYHGIGGAINVSRIAFGDTAKSGDSSMLGEFPSKGPNGLHLSPVLVLEGTAGPRGKLPGAYHCPQSKLSAVFKPEVGFRPGEGEFLGSVLMSLGVGVPGADMSGIGFFDPTTPWRQ